MKIFYFTATGNSLYVAKRLGGELYSIPQVLKEGNLCFKDEKIGIVFPCYYLGVPRIIKEFLEKISLESDYIFAIMTYGNQAGDGIEQFVKLAKSEGIKISYGQSLLMIDNYIPMFDMKDQLAKEDSKKIEENLNDIIKDVELSKQWFPKRHLLKQIVTIAAQKFYMNKKGMDDIKLTVSDSCTACKICEKVCPVNNIVVTDKPYFKNNCDECLGCINICPSKSISHKREKSRERFRNQNVSVNEIIQSNQ